MGVVTAVFQYANGSPVANGAYQWKLSSDAIQFSTASNCTVPTLIGGNLDANGNMTSTFAFNDVLSTTAGAVTTYQLTVKAQNGGQVWNENYYLTGSAANLNLIPPSGGAPFVTVTSSTVSLPAAQIGDIIRYNVNSDTAWDAVNFAGPVSVAYPVFGGSSGGTPLVFGPMSTGNGYSGAHTSVNPTATLGMGDQWSITAAATTTSGWTTGQNGNNSIEGMLAFYRYTMKCQIAATAASIRCWLGLASYTNTGSGNNNVNVTGTARYAADSPNATTIGFRYSSGTDTHWQAVVAQGAGSQVLADTGITPDNNAHVFEMVPNSAGTSMVFFIDTAPVATISSNLPSQSTANGWGNAFFVIDNKNATATVSGILYYWAMAHK